MGLGRGEEGEGGGRTKCIEWMMMRGSLELGWVCLEQTKTLWLGNGVSCMYKQSKQYHPKGVMHGQIIFTYPCNTSPRTLTPPAAPGLTSPGDLP